MAVPAAEETRYACNGEVRIAFTDLGGAGGEPLLLIMGPARHLARVGHYLPAAVYPQVADEVRALADRAATAAPKPG